MKDLKVSYQRNLNSNYLIFEPQNRFLLDIKCKYAFEMGMIENNSIPNFIRPVIRKANKNLEIAYDISSMQPLSRVLEVREVKAEYIKNLIAEISCAAKSLEEFLLDSSSVVLDPEFIYLDIDFKRFHFIYMPGADSNIDDIKKLFEHILSNICKDDKDCLIMVYSMMQECQKRDFLISDLEDMPVLNINEEAKKDDGFTEPDSVATENKSSRMDAAEGRESKKSSFSIFGNIFKNNRAERKPVYDEDVFERVYDEYEPFGRVTVPKEESEGADIPTQTVLLNDNKKADSERVLKDLSGKEDISLSYFPFIIGKQERICDHILDIEGVSRMHLQIFEMGDELYAKDLNSRNGSLINGRRLENEENMRLHYGDIVNICGREYRLEPGK